MEAAPIPAPVINVFNAVPATIDEGQSTTLNWVTEYGDTVTIVGIGDLPAAGQVLVNPTSTTEYTLTVTNETGSVSQNVTVNVIPTPTPDPVISFFTAVPDTIDQGEFTTISWSTQHANTVTLEGFGEVNANGSLILSPEDTTSYTLTATNGSGTATAEITITVNPVVPNTEPVADAGIDFQVNDAGLTVQLNGSASFDPDGDSLSYAWEQLTGPTVTLTGADTATPSFTTLNRGDVYTFRLVVSDGRGGVDTDTVTVIVLDF